MIRSTHHEGLGRTCDRQVSEFHREVSSSLARLGLVHSLERVTDCGLFSLDIVLDGSNVCIEVGG